MNENIDLSRILSNAPKGIILYSIIHGEVLFESIEHDKEPYSILITTLDTPKKFIYFANNGQFYAEKGECCLFPSKDQRDWSKFKVDLLKGTPCMISDDLIVWTIGYYDKDSCVFTKDINVPIIYQHIVPVDKFNFEDCSFNSYDDFGITNKEINNKNIDLDILEEL